MHFYCVSVHLYIILLMVQTAQCGQTCILRMNVDKITNWVGLNSWNRPVEKISSTYN